VKKKTLYPIIIILLFIFSSCFPLTTTTSTSTTNNKSSSTGAIYNPYIYRIHPEYLAYHAPGQSSRLYTKIYLDELMFAPIGPNKSAQAKVKIDYKVYPYNNTSNYVDSASVIYDIKKRKDQNNAITYINIKDNGLSKYYLHIITSDVLRQTRVDEYMLINKEGVGSRQNFLIELKGTNVPYFKNYFRSDQTFSLKYNKPIDSIYIKYSANPMPLPYPPYSSTARADISMQADSIWIVSGLNDFQFREQKKGFYFIQADTSSSNGVGMLNAGSDFPSLKSSESMVYPLEYLMSTIEFSEILNSSNKKLSVDKFWQSTTKEANRTRELIRIYYSRVFYANTYFTSFTEGWRTDRGMIYLMFGPPKAVNKTLNKETWIYSDKVNYRVLQFVFNKVQNPYSDNDFLLERSIDFRQFWSKALNSWRKGKVYNVFD